MREYLIIYHHFVKLATVAVFVVQAFLYLGFEIVLLGVFGVVAGDPLPTASSADSHFNTRSRVTLSYSFRSLPNRVLIFWMMAESVERLQISKISALSLFGEKVFSQL